MDYIIQLIDKYWRFDNNQQPMSSWHEKQDLITLLQNIPKEKYYQVCPKCDGEGRVDGIGISSSSHRPCPVCNGAKILLVSQ